jgi:nucleotide-binding universal stress UspA family protein|uniref:Universal stress protein n=1 Tax=Desulfobacca acetoxidans TaxID=60893 RepID=A0A7C5ELF4_9BACT
MAGKLLIALDSSEGAWRAVEYVARTFGQTPGTEVMLMHVLGGLPPAFWDDGHILSHQEREARQRLIAGWQAEQERRWEGLVNKAREVLSKAGVTAVTSKFKPKYFDVAEDLVNEAVEGGFSTIVMGRRGLGTAKGLLLGSVTHKVVQNSRGLAVIIVS